MMGKLSHSRGALAHRTNKGGVDIRLSQHKADKKGKTTLYSQVYKV